MSAPLSVKEIIGMINQKELEKLTVVCIACGKATPTSESISCPDRHDLCVNCFQRDVTSQMSTLRLFEERLCKYKCCACSYLFPNVVDYLSTSSLQVYQESVESVRIAKAQRAQELEAIQHVEAVSMNSSDQKTRVIAHFNEIVRQFFELSCPGCRGGLPLEQIDFNRCMGQTCLNPQCGVTLCIWCLKNVGAGYAEHIKWCSSNPRPGSTTSSLQELRTQKNNAIRTGVPLYLQSNIERESDRAKVIERLSPLLLKRGIAL